MVFYRLCTDFVFYSLWTYWVFYRLCTQTAYSKQFAHSWYSTDFCHLLNCGFWNSRYWLGIHSSSNVSPRCWSGLITVTYYVEQRYWVKACTYGMYVGNHLSILSKDITCPYCWLAQLFMPGRKHIHSRSPRLCFLFVVNCSTVEKLSASFVCNFPPPPHPPSLKIIIWPTCIIQLEGWALLIPEFAQTVKIFTVKVSLFLKRFSMFYPFKYNLHKGPA